MRETRPKETVLQNRYEIIRVLRIGDCIFGDGLVVYQAGDLRFPHTRRLVTIKELINLATDQTVYEMVVRLFEREAVLLANLNHPAIPRIFDYFSEGNRSYQVLEFVEGQDLETMLQEKEAFLPEEKVTAWAIELCDVLNYLHNCQPRPVIFRGMKPSNVMVDQHGHIHLIDFTMARFFQPGQKGTRVGTEGYSPPEQYQGSDEPRSDLYALGATLHHLLTRRDPRLELPFSFHEHPIRSINPGISESLEAIVMKALQYDLDKRFSSAQEMKLALMALVK